MAKGKIGRRVSLTIKRLKKKGSYSGNFSKEHIVSKCSCSKGIAKIYNKFNRNISISK